MSEKPILVIQMQRLGDLILTFPLLIWLQQQYPKHPIWVVAERGMFEGLMPLSPHVTFFPREALSKIERTPCDAVINLSHRPEAAICAGKVPSEIKIGPYTDAEGNTYINGKWQLYRSSLIHNNRHNLFHWADLNALDFISPKLMQSTAWPPPDHNRPDNARIGLFLGASEASKRPTLEFWAKLAKELLKRGLAPVFLGGPDESELGKAVSKLVGYPQMNLCGKFSLLDFAGIIANLRTLITPDTGPMHLAAWTHTPTLNLSMGPVNPWETGPYQPGHHVLRTHISCTGCWQCKHPSILCRDAFSASRVAAMAHMIAVKGSDSLQHMRPPKQDIFVTGRDVHGLYQLTPTGRNIQPRQLLAQFWKRFFGAHFGLWQIDRAQSAWNALQSASPHLVPYFHKSIAGVGKELSLAIRRSGGPTCDAAYWEAHPPFLRPLTGYLHLLLHNGNYSRPAYAEALTLLEMLNSLSST